VTIEKAIDQVNRQQRDAPDAKVALYAARRKILENAQQHTQLLERPGRSDTYIYSRPTTLSALSIGRVCSILPKDLDAALIKVRLSTKYGVEKKLCQPPNILRPPRVVSDERAHPSMAELPDKLTALSSLSVTTLQELFGKGEQKLMKYGARSGFSAFHAGPGAILLNGRRCMEIVPVVGGGTFAKQVVIEPGDSSAPVFDARGVVHGMVSAKLKYEEVGFIVLMSDIISAAAKEGYDLRLA
jgi:hypothetical protein